MKQHIRLLNKGQGKLLLLWTKGKNKGQFVYNNGHPLDVTEPEATDIMLGQMPSCWGSCRKDYWDYLKGKVNAVRYLSGSIDVDSWKATA